MILVSVVTGADTVQHHLQIFFPVIGQPVFLFPVRKAPASVGLQIVLRDHIQSIDVAESVDHGIIGIMAGTDRVDIILLHDDHICDHIFTSRRSSCPAGEFMAVCPVEYDTLSIQLHQTAFQFKVTEAHKLARRLCHMTVSILQHHLKFIQIRFLRTPGFHTRDVCPDRAVLRAHLSLGSRDICIKLGILHSGWSGDPSLNQFPGQDGSCDSTGQGSIRAQHTVCHSLIQVCDDLQILNMDSRNGVQDHITEDPRQAIHILILQPGTIHEFEVQHSKTVLSLPEIGSQVKVRGGEGVLTVPHVCSVHPQCESRFHAFKGNAHIHSLPLGRDRKKCDILGSGIESLRSFSLREILPSVPGVLGIDIGRLIISFHLYIGRNTYLSPAAHVILRLLDAFQGAGRIHGIMKLPHSVQAFLQTAVSRLPDQVASVLFHLSCTSVQNRIGMCRECMNFENRRVINDSDIKLIHFSHPCPCKQQIWFCRSVKRSKPLHHCTVPEPGHLIFGKHVLFRAVILTADTVVLTLLRIIEHIDVKVPHETGRTPVIQFSFASLSHVVTSSPSPSSVRYPSVNIGENAYPSSM